MARVEFWDRVTKSETCWVWTGSCNGDGYGTAWSPGSVRGARGSVRGAHRVAWESINGPIPAGLNVLHHCDNPPCVRPDHLYLGTQRDNALDRERRGRGRGAQNLIGARHARGEDASTSVLKEADVLAIRAEYALGGIRQLDIARRYGVARSTIQAVVSRRNWAWHGSEDAQ